MRKHIIFSFLLLLLLCSCGNNSSEKKADTTAIVSNKARGVPEHFASGEIIPNVICKAEPLHGYALYLPKNIDQNKKHPVVFFFDAHARGSMPLKLYQSLADKYGYILCGSNTSKNGMDNSLINNMVLIFFQDALLRLPIDTGRIYLAGFSGGARIAIAAAMGDNRIKGVIANSAGFDTRQQTPRPSLVYVGLAGNEDFNLTELDNTEQALMKLSNPHYLGVFDGKHDWAPEKNMDDAFLLMELNAMKKKQTTLNDTLVEMQFLKDKKIAEGYKQKNLLKEELSALRKIISFYEGLKDISSFKTSLEKLEQSQGMKTIEEKQKQLREQELAEQQKYGAAFSDKDLEWWATEVKKLNNSIKTSGNKETVQYDKRLLSYMSLLAYMNINSAIKQEVFPVADQFIQIYEMVDPSNSEWAYLSACVLAHQGKNDEAIVLLEKAAELGFTDVERMNSERDFLPLHYKQGFEDLVNKIMKSQE